MKSSGPLHTEERCIGKRTSLNLKVSDAGGMTNAFSVVFSRAASSSSTDRLKRSWTVLPSTSAVRRRGSMFLGRISSKAQFSRRKNFRAAF